MSGIIVVRCDTFGHGRLPPSAVVCSPVGVASIPVTSSDVLPGARNGSGSHAVSARGVSASLAMSPFFRCSIPIGGALALGLRHRLQNASLRHPAEIVVHARLPSGCRHIEIDRLSELIGTPAGISNMPVSAPA